MHTREVSQDAPKKSSIFIDCGCESSEEVEALGIQVGDFITYTAGLLILNKKFFVGRAMDNRVGGFIVARTAQLLREHNFQLPYSLYIVNSVQEEIGTKGAIMMANSIKPNCAFVVDVTHDTNTPMIDKNKEGDLASGKGPVIIKAPPIHLALHKLLLNTAKENRIPIQMASMAKETGTDADAFAYEAGGIPTALISFPLRYMHTTVETIHKSDVENSIRLLYETLKKLSPEFDFQYIKIDR